MWEEFLHHIRNNEVKGLAWAHIFKPRTWEIEEESQFEASLVYKEFRPEKDRHQDMSFQYSYDQISGQKIPGYNGHFQFISCLK